MKRLIFCIALLAECAFAQTKSRWLFRDRPYYRPLTAEPRAAQTSILFPAVSDGVPFAVKAGRSFAWDISVGKELPILGWDSNPATDKTAKVGAGEWGLGVFLPLSFHMIEDMGKDPSNPILNTDYRFGFMLKGQYGLPDKKFFGTDGHIGFRAVPLAHESTHIGDEFTLGALREHPSTFQRVNVSYEYWELGGSFEPNYLQDGRLEVTLRGGAIRAFDQKKGWYAAELLYPFPSGRVAPSVRNYEPYVGGEVYLAPGVDSAGKDKMWGWFASLDARNRTIYNYARTVGQPDEAQWSTNVMVGARQIRQNSVIRPSYFLRYYHGVNPSGQFRSQRDYQLFGFGVLFEF